MKVEVTLKLMEGNETSKIYIDENEVRLEKEGEIVVFETTYENRFNTLVALFSCSKLWKKNTLNFPVYSVVICDKEENKYDFDETPDNWNLFMGYIYRLIGELL